MPQISPRKVYLQPLKPFQHRSDQIIITNTTHSNDHSATNCILSVLLSRKGRRLQSALCFSVSWSVESTTPCDYLDLVLSVFHALVERTIKAKMAHVVDTVKALDAVWYTVHLKHVDILWHRSHCVNLEVWEEQCQGQKGAQLHSCIKTQQTRLTEDMVYLGYIDHQTAKQSHPVD